MQNFPQPLIWRIFECVLFESLMTSDGCLVMLIKVYLHNNMIVISLEKTNIQDTFST